MHVYFDTGVFIDYLSARGIANAILRSSPRRGRTPAEMAADAETLFEEVSLGHTGATSCLTYYEAEEALYRVLARSAKGASRANKYLIPSARSITVQVQIVVDLFNISVLDLTSGTVRVQLEQLNLQTGGFALSMRFTQRQQLYSTPIFWFRPMTLCFNWMESS